jgi:hypothetical protein
VIADAEERRRLRQGVGRGVSRARSVSRAALCRADSIRMQSGQILRCSEIKECKASISIEGYRSVLRSSCRR